MPFLIAPLVGIILAVLIIAATPIPRGSLSALTAGGFVVGIEHDAPDGARPNQAR
jgi:hypothetical protein